MEDRLSGAVCRGANQGVQSGSGDKREDAEVPETRPLGYGRREELTDGRGKVLKRKWLPE